MKAPLPHYELMAAYRARQAWDPAHLAIGQTNEDREWLAIWPCRRGGSGSHLFIHGAEEFGFTGRGMALQRELLAIPGVRPHQTGDQEFSVVFPLALINRAANIVRLRTRKQISQEHLAKLRDGLEQSKRSENSPSSEPKTGQIQTNGDGRAFCSGRVTRRAALQAKTDGLR